jgi:hypothetical protein
MMTASAQPNAESRIYLIDQQNRIIHVDSGWDEAARANQASERVTAASVIGHSILEFIADPMVRELFRLLYERIRSQQKGQTIPFRCDSPTLRRSLELRLEPLPNLAILHESRLLHSEERAAVWLWSTTAERSTALITACSWCKRLQYHDSWVEAEEMIRQGDLFNQMPLPQITHGICTSCLATFDLGLPARP